MTSETSALLYLADHPEDGEALGAFAADLRARSDVRGEFIQLSLAEKLPRAQRQRQKELLKGDEVLPGIAAAVARRGRQFERGLLVGCTLRSPPQNALETAVGHPLWSTVRRVRIERRLTDAMVRLLTNMPRLIELDLREAAVDDLAWVSSLERLEELSLYGTDTQCLEPLTSLARLRNLDIGNTNVSSLDPLLRITSLEQLWTLWVDEEHDWPGEQIEAPRLSDEFKRDLKRAIPKLSINGDEPLEVVRDRLRSSQSWQALGPDAADD